MMAHNPMVGSRLSFLFGFILISAAVPMRGESIDDAARGLARKIAAIAKSREPAALTFRNLSSMSATENAAARAAIERELHAQGAGGAGIVVTISENLHRYLWVAEIHRGEAREIVMEEMPRPAPAAATAALSLEARLVFEDDHRILDLAAAHGGMLVLDEQGLAFFESGQKRQVVPVAFPTPKPRDLRGRLIVEGETFQAFVSGQHCTGAIRPSLTIACREATLWPVAPGISGEFVKARNFFGGRLVVSNGSEKMLAPFFSAAVSEDRGNAVWLFAGVDGRTHAYNSAFEPAGDWDGWGSDVAGIGSGCARSTVLATRPGDAGAPDAIQAYTVLDGSPQALSEPVSFPGPVIALWTVRSEAFAISRDLRTGRYAAFSLGIVCNQ
jgi:hypothetical protein